MYYVLIIPGESLLIKSRNSPFSTYDRDNDRDDASCSKKYHGAWWFEKCFKAHLNGLYPRNGENVLYAGIIWESWRGFHESFKASAMKTRPAGFTSGEIVSGILVDLHHVSCACCVLVYLHHVICVCGVLVDLHRGSCACCVLVDLHRVSCVCVVSVDLYLVI